MRPNEQSRQPGRLHDNIGLRLDAVVFDIGGTIVIESPAGTPVHALVPQLLPGVASDLAELARSVRIGAATNTAVMSEPDVRKLLARVGIDHYFEVVTTSHDVGAAKPDPTVLLVAMRQFGLVDASRILYVGDREIDQQAASAAGMEFAMVADTGLMSAVLSWARAKRT